MSEKKFTEYLSVQLDAIRRNETVSIETITKDRQVIDAQKIHYRKEDYSSLDPAWLEMACSKVQEAIDLAESIISQHGGHYGLLSGTALDRFSSAIDIAERHISAIRKEVWVRKGEALSPNGRKGGRKSSRKSAWAEWVAVELAKKVPPGKPEQKAWDYLPESVAPWVREPEDFAGGEDFECYRDGDELIAENDSGSIEKLKRSTFLRNYYRPARRGR